MRSRESLRRRAYSKERFRRYLIVCEGEVTEKFYFNDLRVFHKIPIHVELLAGGVPRTLVEWAIKRRNEVAQTAIRERDEALNFDEVWVVCDVDQHPRLSEAKEQATQNGISVAISSPRCELRALLHFQDDSAHIARV